MTLTHRPPGHAPTPWEPGSWVQARLRRFDVTILTLVLAGIALSRAWDYATPPPWAAANPHPSVGLAVVESAAPMYMWVIALAVPAVLLALSAILRIHRGIWAGHGLLAVVYAGLWGGLTAEYLAQPWGDGIRSGTILILPCALHLLFCVRTGWRPRQWASS